MTSAQSFIPNDSATVRAPAGGNLAGSVKFEAFESATARASAIYNQDVPVSGASPQTVGRPTPRSPPLRPRLVAGDVHQHQPGQRSIPATCLEKTALTIDNDGTVTSP